jgi:hypothetical protein
VNLLTADENGSAAWRDTEISTPCGVGLNTISKGRKGCMAHGALETVKRQKPNRVYERVMAGKAEAHRVALSCSPPPEETAPWTLQLLAVKMVERCCYPANSLTLLYACLSLDFYLA